jgi:hypothetical protein
MHKMPPDVDGVIIAFFPGDVNFSGIFCLGWLFFIYVFFPVSVSGMKLAISPAGVPVYLFPV